MRACSGVQSGARLRSSGDVCRGSGLDSVVVFGSDHRARGVAFRILLLGVFGWACGAPATQVLHAPGPAGPDVPVAIASPKTTIEVAPAPAAVAGIVQLPEAEEARDEASHGVDEDAEVESTEGFEGFDEPEPNGSPPVVKVDVSRLTPKELRAIKDQMIAVSIDEYDGPCPCPYNTMRNGRSCGGRSAYSRPGGESPLCYAKDITADMVRAFVEGNGWGN
jgi:hypothetical protein